MLTITTNGHAKNCEGTSRRELLRIGTLGFGGLGLANMLALPALGASGRPIVRDKAVVVLNLQGGPTHIETFDPKMTAPVEYRAMFGEVATRIPGVTFGSHFTQLANLADRMSVVRSYRHGIGSHGRAAQHVMAGGNPTEANMGSLYTRLAGTTDPKSGIPNCTVLVPGAVSDKYSKIGAQTSRVTAIGTLPSIYKPFDPSAGGDIVNNMKLRIGENRLDDRRALLDQFDTLKRKAESTGILEGASGFQQQAFDVILGGISTAFDISREDPRLVKRYDTSHFDIPEKLYKKKNKNLLKQSPVALGKQMLMARRLAESGCGLVTVTSAGWDMHGNAFGIDDGMPLLGGAVDKAVSAFIEDLEQRGLTDKVLLVITGEFGRTPKINKKGGRDHWGNLCTLAFAGGGLPMGKVIGASDKRASVPATTPISSSNVFATIMHTLFDVAELRITSGIPAEILNAIVDAPPIPGLA